MEYSFQDFTNQSFIDANDIPAQITGSCFYQENMHTDKAVVDFDIFPPGTVCTFIRCNMSNVKKQAGFTYIDCQEEILCVQIDGEDWLTDMSGNAVEPKDMFSFIELGIPVDPLQITNAAGGDRVTKEIRGQIK